MRCNSDIFAMYLHSTKSEYQRKTATTNKQQQQQQQRKKVKPVRRKRETMNTNTATVASHWVERKIDKSIDICIIRNVIMLLPYFVLLAFAFSPFLVPAAAANIAAVIVNAA